MPAPFLLNLVLFAAGCGLACLSRPNRMDFWAWLFGGSIGIAASFAIGDTLWFLLVIPFSGALLIWRTVALRRRAATA